MKFKLAIPFGGELARYMGEKAVAVASDDYYRKPHAWNEKAGAFVLVRDKDGELRWRTVAPEQLVEARGTVWFDMNERMSNRPYGAEPPQLVKIHGVRWITSAGNLCEIRTAIYQVDGNYGLVLAAEGRRHGIPWLFSTEELERMLAAGTVLEYETHAPSQRPWMAGVEAEIPVEEEVMVEA